jgi:tripartite ATP-independent transporter DctP family solute receptor
MRRFNRFIIAVMIMLAAINSFGAGKQESAAVKTTVLRLGNADQAGTPSGKGTEKFAELVERYTNGAYKVEVFLAGALGNTNEVMENIMDGKGVHLNWAGISWFERIANDFKIFSLNWAFDDNAHLVRFTETDRFKVMLAELEKKNLKLLGWYAFRNPRHVFSTKPIRNLDDFKGLIIRVPPQPMYQRSWAAVGTSPTQMAYGEVYMSLRQNVIQAMENPIESAFGTSMHEVAKNVVLTGHLLNPNSIVMNAESFNKMEKTHQDAFLKAAKDAGEYFSSIVGAEEENIKKEMREKHGVQFFNVDIAALAARIVPFAQEQESKNEWSKGLFEYVRSLAKK